MPADCSETRLAIVCPMANESETAISFVQQVFEQTAQLASVRMFVVLDRVSTDGTLALMREYARHEPRLGVIWAPENRCVVDAYIAGYRAALAEGSWCPFNSQNTAWFPDAYPLMYLPPFCSFRVTDIWRSFVAQRIAWLNGWAILYEGPTVRQERNEHDLMKDFADEIPGYLNNRAIASRLMTLDLEPGLEHIPGNMRVCYRNLIEMGLVGEEEMGLLEAWLGDLAALS